MKKNIKLLLLAALAWPGIAMAQDIKHEVVADHVLANHVAGVVGDSLDAVKAIKPVEVLSVNKAKAPAKRTDAKDGGVYEENVNFSVNICRGNETNQYVPAYGYYFESEQEGQMIYPASLVGLSKGDKISSITFYTNSNFRASNQVRLRIGETAETVISAGTYATNRDNAQVYYSGTMPYGTNNQLTFTLTTPYVYQGENLMIDLQRVSGTNFTSNQVNFYGINAPSGSSYQTYGNNGAQSFLPQITINYSNIGRVSGNKDFFSSISYGWTDDEGKTHTSTLDSVATDPDQIIAMLREVYTNKSIPGNFKRGYSSTGELESYIYNDVQYPGLGRIGTITYDDDTYVTYEDSYGWNVESEICDAGSYNVNNRSYQCFYMNPNEYKPDHDGLTLLLLETVDQFNPAEVRASITATGGYEQLREYISKSIKSARIITEAKRTGDVSDRSSGTLFKIDCDKMNEFFFVAKGQLRWLRSAYYQGINGVNKGYLRTFYEDPCFWYYNGNYGYSDADIEVYYLLGHMFEQFSPVTPDQEGGQEDIYQDLIGMNSFGVKHDCVNVPFIDMDGKVISHHFKMYGEGSDAADCQDVRDMMFFVPDYRMSYTSNRGQASSTYTDMMFQDYYNYNTDHQPMIGLFVIHQDEIPAGTKISSNESTTTDPAQLKGLYKHQLKWYSNLDDFLPSDEQYYELWELVVDEFGKESYVPVYYRNANGEYRVEQNGQVSWVSDTAGLSQYLVPIVLSRNSAATVTETVNDKQVTKLLYTDVYVDMMAGSQTKTYVVRGRDSENFLSLQMSNQEEVVIPGLDPKEKVRLIGATYYSRYNPDNQKNCYSNKLEMKNNATGLTSSDVTGKTIKFYRSSRAAQVDGEGNVVTDAQGNIQYVGDEQVEKFPFATGTINGSNLVITLAGQALENEFPAGASDFEHGDLRYAGYHANGNLTFPFTVKAGDMLDFGNLMFWDNFTVDVSENKHPLQYLYRMEVGGANSDVADSYSNNVRVPVYKTASRINPPLTKEQVEGDTSHNPDYSPGDVEFGAQVQLSSKTEILRYDAYRWDENTTKRFIVDEVYNNDTEQDLPPDGMAGNQGDFYTVSMNDVNDPRYYYAATGSDQPAVTTGQPLNWATFVDYYPKKVADEASEGMAYVYAPVVELFTKGYNATNANLARKDYNTYGGPMQKSAVGKVDGAIVKVSIGGEEGYETSTMTWKGENDKIYCYYNLPVSIDVLGLPANYEVYKIRAWRQIDTKLLGECPSSEGPHVPDRSDRISGDYLFEELNFGDDMYNDPEAQTVRNVSAASLLHYNLGDRLSTREDAQHNERMATFGAVKLGAGESMDVKIIVRVYFTKGNGEENGNSQHGPRRVLTPENLSADGKYYVAEKVVTTQIQGSGIVTDLDNLKANREVESVNYVNTMGQVSNRPWQGVNVVVTRYTDGTTRTTKAVY